jgi:thymidylate synthase ThyX
MKMITAKIIADSVNKSSGSKRITTFILTYPRFIHAELLTHRTFSRNAASCLAGDTEIYIDKPSFVKKNKNSLHMKMKISELYKKWTKGDSLNRKMKNRLKEMNLRCLNEDTGKFITTKMVDCVFSGIKDIYEIELENGFKLKCTKEHRIFTDKGWKTLNDINIIYKDNITYYDKHDFKISTNGFPISEDFLFSERDKYKKNLKTIAEENNISYKSLSYFCENHKINFNNLYKSGKKLSDFMYHNSNLELKCNDINKPKSKGNYLISKFFKIKNVKYLGKEDTYDLEVEGPYHNFVANGIVVHNSRAIPISKYIEDVLTDPALPVHWGKNQKGMQANDEVDEDTKTKAMLVWNEARDSAVQYAKKLQELGLHKQVVNRILEPYFHITTLLTATEFDNFFKLRAHKDAQPEIRELAYKMLELYKTNKPEEMELGEWHIPFGDKYTDGLSLEQKLKIATARAARVSYKTFDGKIDYEKDYELHDNLLKEGHYSPFEHCAQAEFGVFDNFNQWKSYRKMLK